MISGTFTVTASDNPDLAVGTEYPLNIDDTSVTLSFVTTSVVTAVGTQTSGGDTTSAPTPTDAVGGAQPGDNEIAPGVPTADEVDNGPAQGEQLAPESTPPATA